MTIDRYGTPRERAAAAVVDALRWGEGSAAARAAACLAEDVVMAGPKGRIEGAVAVAARLAGQWPITPVLAAGTWEIAPAADGRIEASAVFPGVGAAPKAYRLAFEFDVDDRIATITEQVEPFVAAPTTAIPPVIRARIDRAMADGVPIVMGYVDDEGHPAVTLRGSLRTVDGATLCLWIRDPKGGLVRAIAAGRPLSFLYRHSPSRTTLTGKGTGEIVGDPALRAAIYARTAEGDQRHDPGQAGVAALVHVGSIRGTSPEGPVVILPERAA